MYAEYIYVNDAWEKLGEQSVNLNDYAKISDVDASLDLKADKTSIPTVKFWTGTQAEYDAIATKDDNTVYFVK
jgi:hypothetical protein